MSIITGKPCYLKSLSKKDELLAAKTFLNHTQTQKQPHPLSTNQHAIKSLFKIKKVI